MPASGLFPSYIGILVVLVAVVGGAWAVVRLRQNQMLRTWQNVATWLNGKLDTAEFVGESRSGMTERMRVKGRLRDHAAFFGEGVSYEDAVPYPHTRGAINVRNPASVVLGLRHKSMLEEALTRKEARVVETGDGDFDRVFFLHLNLPEYIEALLTSGARQTLMRYADVELYLKGTQIEWRRAGTLRSETDIKRLFELIADMADVLDTLPYRELTLSEKMAEEAVITEGI